MVTLFDRDRMHSSIAIATFAATALVFALEVASLLLGGTHTAVHFFASVFILLCCLALGRLLYLHRSTPDWEHQGQFFLSLLSEGIVVLDSLGNVAWNNAAALEILGVSKEQLLERGIGSPQWKLVKEDGNALPPDQHPAMVSLRTGEPSKGAILGLVGGKGERAWVNMNAKPVRFRSQSYVCLTFSDITQLIFSKSESRHVLDALGIGVWKFNPITQDLLWDDSMYRLFEIEQAKFPGHYKAWESALTPEAKNKAVEELNLALIGEKPFSTTFEIQTKSGRKKHIGGRGKVIRDELGKAIMMHGVNWDRTKEVHDELELEHRQALLTAVLDNIPYIVFVKDAKDEFKYTLLNKAGEALLGNPEVSLIGRKDTDLFPPELAAYLGEKDQEIVAGGAPLEIPKEPIKTPLGLRWLRTFKVPTYLADGQPDLIIGISADITDELLMRENLEKERARTAHTAKLASLGEMSAGIAHEINNPLAHLSGTIALLEKCKHDAEKFQMKIKSMGKSIERIGKIVRSLRNFARHSSVKSRHWVPVQDIIYEALTLTEAKAKRCGAEIRFNEIDAVKIYCDSVEIEQVLVNLVNNGLDAVKDLNERWVEIRVFKDVDAAVIQVIDSGQGIVRDLQLSIFQPFFTTKPLGEGTGLGLSISKGILEDHKATIELNCQSKQTCFEIRFPNNQEGADAA